MSKRTFQQWIAACVLIAACSACGAVDDTPEVTAEPTDSDSPTSTPLPIDTSTPIASQTPPPTLLPELPNPFITSIPVVAIETSGLHSLALLENGDVLGWGSAQILGLSEHDVIQPTPLLLPNLHNIKAVYADQWESSIFIDEDGRIHELGLIERGKYSVFPDIDSVQQVAVGTDETLLALKEDGSVWGWGNGEEGQLGVGELINTSKFVKVSLDNVMQIMFVGRLALAVRNDGTLWAWGKNYDHVTGSEAIWMLPQQVEEVQDVKAVANGDGVSILHSDGRVTVLLKGEFHPAQNLPPLSQISSGDNLGYSFGITEDGSLWAWGAVWPGAFYLDPPPPYEAYFGPERFEGHQSDLENIFQISSESVVTLALDNAGTVWAWGSNGFGAIGFSLEYRHFNEPIPVIVYQP